MVHQKRKIGNGDKRTAGDELRGDVDALLFAAADASFPDAANPCVHGLSTIGEGVLVEILLSLLPSIPW